MRNSGYRILWSLLGLLMGAATLLSLLQNLLSFGVSDSVAVLVAYYRSITQLLFGGYRRRSAMKSRTGIAMRGLGRLF